jgi:hypothetical protein
LHDWSDILFEYTKDALSNLEFWCTPEGNARIKKNDGSFGFILLADALKKIIIQHEISNFQILSKIIEEKSLIDKWVPSKRNFTPNTEQTKAKRIWHKGAVMTWGPMLPDILINSCNLRTTDERQKLLYRQPLTQDQIDRITTCLERLFNHSLWIDPKPEIDKLLMSASRQDDLFKKYSLTINYILTGTP